MLQLQLRNSLVSFVIYFYRYSLVYKYNTVDTHGESSTKDNTQRQYR